MEHTPEEIALIEKLIAEGKSDSSIQISLWKAFPNTLKDENLTSFISETRRGKGASTSGDQWPAQETAVNFSMPKPGDLAYEPSKQGSKKVAKHYWDSEAEYYIEERLSEIVEGWLEQPVDKFDAKVTTYDEDSDESVWVGLKVDLSLKGTTQPLYTLKVGLTGTPTADESWEPEGREVSYYLENIEYEVESITTYNADGSVVSVENVNVHAQLDAPVAKVAKRSGLSLSDALLFFTESPELLGKSPIDIDLATKTVRWDDESKTTFDETVQLAMDHATTKESDFGMMDGPVDLGKKPEGDFPSVSWMPSGESDKDVAPNNRTANRENSAEKCKCGHIRFDHYIPNNAQDPLPHKCDGSEECGCKFFKKANMLKQAEQKFSTPVHVDSSGLEQLLGVTEMGTVKPVTLQWSFDLEMRNWGIKSVYVSIPDQALELEYEFFNEKTDGYERASAKLNLTNVEVTGWDNVSWNSQLAPRSLSFNGKWVVDFSNLGYEATNHVNLGKTAQDTLTPEMQDQIASKWGPEMNIALMRYAEARTHGHPVDRAIAFALNEVSRLKLQVKPENLKEAINTYIAK